MEYFAIAFTAFCASLLTFFSGFGLSTILTPVFVIFFPVDIAIALTAVVHFLNNIFKAGLTAKSINWPVTLKFGLPAIGAAVVGAYVLGKIDSNQVLLSYNILSLKAEVMSVKIIVSILMIVFALIELVPALKRIQFDANKIYLGGLLSGFFGGLSGHQGALRSIFLLKCNLSKEGFIASGIMIALFIDTSRISIYLNNLSFEAFSSEGKILITAVMAAFLGAYFGKKLLKKVTLNFVQNTVSTLIIILALLLGVGIL